eukprot:PhM_4_TR18190/c0_g1_i1/m.85405
MSAHSYAADLDVLAGLHRQLIAAREENEKYRAFVQKGVDYIEEHHAQQALDNIFLSRTNEDLNRKIVEQTDEIAMLTTKLEIAFEESQRLSRDNQSLVRSLRSKEVELVELKRKVDAHVYSHKTTYNLLKQLDQERTGAFVQGTKLEDEVRSLKQKLSVRHEETWAVEKQLGQVSDELDRARQENGTLRNELRKFKDDNNNVIAGENCQRPSCLESKRQLALERQKLRRLAQKYPHMAREFDVETSVDDGGGGGAVGMGAAAWRRRSKSERFIGMSKFGGGMTSKRNNNNNSVHNNVDSNNNTISSINANDGNSVKVSPTATTTTILPPIQRVMSGAAL